MTKIVNAYIAYDLDVWSRNPTNNFKFKNYLLGWTSIVKNSDKEKSGFSGYGIKFDSAGWWGFDNGTARNFIIFDVDNSSSSHSGNRKNILLTLGESPSFGLNGSFAWPHKKFYINFIKTNRKFCLCSHYKADNS